MCDCNSATQRHDVPSIFWVFVSMSSAWEAVSISRSITLISTSEKSSVKDEVVACKPEILEQMLLSLVVNWTKGECLASGQSKDKSDRGTLDLEHVVANVICLVSTLYLQVTKSDVHIRNVFSHRWCCVLQTWKQEKNSFDDISARNLFPMTSLFVMIQF